tara:strand:+ start:943 stop:1173 length:231 start_codon:yes stop_codon:yes gene_type:complete
MEACRRDALRLELRNALAAEDDHPARDRAAEETQKEPSPLCRDGADAYPRAKLHDGAHSEPLPVVARAADAVEEDR